MHNRIMLTCHVPLVAVKISSFCLSLLSGRAESVEVQNWADNPVDEHKQHGQLPTADRRVAVRTLYLG